MLQDNVVTILLFFFFLSPSVFYQKMFCKTEVSCKSHVGRAQMFGKKESKIKLSIYVQQATHPSFKSKTTPHKCKPRMKD